jgi:hypothetical protein
MWWLIKNGFVLEPKFIGHPVRAALRFKPNPIHPGMPRLPWVNETESRAAGTGLLISWHCIPHHDDCKPHPHGEE